MAILDQALMQKAENGKFIVSEDYNLNGGKIVVPKGMTIAFNNISILFPEIIWWYQLLGLILQLSYRRFPSCRITTKV